jgi:hypothetical protein
MRYLIIVLAVLVFSCDRGCYMKPDKKSKETKHYIHRRYPEYKPYKK